MRSSLIRKMVNQMNNRLEAVAGYVGAKNGVVGSRISSVLYREGITTYIEPYSGTWGVGRQSMPYPVEIWNDVDSQLYSLFSVLCNQSEVKELIERMLRTEYSQEYFDNAKSICEADLDKIPDRIQRAVYAWSLMLQSKNGQSREWKGFTKGNETIKYQESIIRKFDLIERFKNVQVSNRDALEWIRELKGRPDVMCMIDSPYVLESRTSEKLYRHDMDDKNQRDLVNLCVDATSKMLLCGYHNSIYESILTPEKGWYCYDLHEVAKSMSFSGLGNRKKRVMEVIWTNYPLTGRRYYE